MRYKVKEILDQIVDTLRGASALSGVTVNITPGEIYDGTLETEALIQKLIDYKKFVFVQYDGKTTKPSNDVKTSRKAILRFKVLVGSTDVVNLEATRLLVFDYLGAIYDVLNGYWSSDCVASVASNLDRLAGLPITGATNETPIVVTCVGHGKATGDKVFVKSVEGNTGANNTSGTPYWTVTKVDADTLSLNSSVGNGAYTTGGRLIAAITATDFRPLSCVTESMNDVEGINLNYPTMLVYETQYEVEVVQ